MAWTDIYSGKRFMITTEPNADSRFVKVKSYSDIFADTLPTPSRRALPAGAPCSRADLGLLQRQRIIGTRIIYIGKESNRLEDVENGALQSWDEVQQTYEDSRRDSVMLQVIPILKQIKCAEIVQKTGYKERHIIAIRNGYGNPSVTLRKALIEIAADYARRFLTEAIVDDLDACAAFAATLRSDITASPQEHEEHQDIQVATMSTQSVLSPFRISGQIKAVSANGERR
jgi:hypothetical protein